MYPAGNLFIPAPHGRLEALLKEVRPPHEARGVALILHPHPQHGGTMHNKVVYRAARALNEAGLTTLRFNFRGVGLSTSTYDEMRGEKDDARTALDYLVAQYPDKAVTLAGFSFGARVGLELGIADHRVANLIGIGAPMDKYDFSFLQRNRKPLLLVHGEHDEFGDARRLRDLAASLPAQAQVQTEIISGAGHFFDAQLDEMQRRITDWIKRVTGE